LCAVVSASAEVIRSNRAAATGSTKPARVGRVFVSGIR
jgi:hypothetical protein